MLVSDCPFPIVLGRPDAVPLQSSGVARAVPPDATDPDVGADRVPAGGVPVRVYVEPSAIVGLPHTLPAGAEGAVVPLAVASAMRYGGHTRPYRIFTPAPLREEGGVKYAPYLLEHVFLK